MGTELLTPGEVARALRVTPRTVTRWATANPPRLRAIRTAGNHRRYLAADVRALLDGITAARAPADRMRENHARIKLVPCPPPREDGLGGCGAPAHQSCRGPNGHVMYIPHQARRHAAAEAGIYVP